MKNLYINDNLIYFIVTTNNPTILIKIHQHLESYVLIEVMLLRFDSNGKIMRWIYEITMIKFITKYYNIICKVNICKIKNKYNVINLSRTQK